MPSVDWDEVTLHAMIVSFAPLVVEQLLDDLVSKDILKPRDARRVREASTNTGAMVERVLLELGLVGEEVLFRAIATQLGLPYAGPEAVDVSLVQALGLAPDYLQRMEVVPLAEAEDGSLSVGFSDPRGAETLSGLAFHLRRRIVPVMVAPSTVRLALNPVSKASDRQSEGVGDADLERLRAMANDGPVIRLVNDMVAEAVQARASDIHVEADEQGARVRLRIDGVLRPHRVIQESDRAAVVSRLKVMANLNISEKRRPQDGRTEVSVRGRTIDIRVSTLPTQFGESVVLRLLDRNRLRLDWVELGFEAGRISEIKHILDSPSGIFLIAGPTGCGKTTTLYTALEHMNSPERKIVTVEDPIEYSINGVVQVQVEPGIDMTFAAALRAILRQDPDVIMIGEIRDQETAAIAIRAALVGRMVLSTIHTNSSISAITRLTDLGVPPFLLAATLRGVLSQRLVRRICPDCGGVGCTICSETGRKGRIVISELLRVTAETAEAIGKGLREEELSQVVRRKGFQLLAESGQTVLSGGLVAQEDLYRAIGIDLDSTE
jgi:general secretion pathway protein E